MKLRFHPNSLRLRLTPKDVALLARTGSVVAEIVFDPQTRLCYELRVDRVRTRMVASFVNGTVRVDIPLEQANRLAGTSDVGFESIQESDDGSALKILVEKDFECLEPAGNEPGEIFYPHPGKSPCVSK